MSSRNRSRSPARRSARSLHQIRRNVFDNRSPRDQALSLNKSQLKENSRGVVVSRAASAAAKKNFRGSALQLYNRAVQEAKRELGIDRSNDFNDHIVKGKLKTTARRIYNEMR